MRELLAVELTVVSRRTLAFMGVALTALAVSFAYFFAIVGRFEGEGSGLLTNRLGVMSLTVTFTVCCATIIGAVLFSRIVIDDYRTSQLPVTLSYPDSRTTRFRAKLIASTLLVTLLTAVSLAIAMTTFWLTEALAPIVEGSYSPAMIGDSAILGLFALVLTAALTCIAGVVGLWRRSSIAAIIAAIILVALVGNGVTSVFSLGALLALGVTAVTALLAAAASHFGARHVERIEPF